MLVRGLQIFAFLVTSLTAINASAAATNGTSVGTSTASYYSDRSFGLGVMLGEPTGLSAKYFLSRDGALDMGLAYSFNSYVALISDYLWHFTGAFASAGKYGSEFVPYIGLGGLLVFDTSDGRRPFGASVYSDGFNGADPGFGIRIPLGIEFRPRTAPIGLSAEVVPGVGIVPGTFGFVQGDVDFRFYI